jgi:hypothetical protein
MAAKLTLPRHDELAAVLDALLPRFPFAELTFGSAGEQCALVERARDAAAAQA